MSRTSIEWTDTTWNPVRGCSRISPGCVNCYAERQAARFADSGGPFQGFVTKVNGHPAWTGKVELIEDKLTEPLRWRKPQRIFVNSMSDLFHEALPDEAIDRVFAVMALCQQHTFQVLTKRADRMRKWATRTYHPGSVNDWLAFMTNPMNREMFGTKFKGVEVPIVSKHAVNVRFPLPNVWLGISAENQQYADERIPLLLQTPAAVRFVSYEPALGPVEFWKYIGERENARGDVWRGIDWVIAGGESGPGARAAHPDWFRSVRDQCAAAGVAFFFKQWGEYCDWDNLPEETAREIDAAGEGGYSGMRRVGKKRAGRLLDGSEHNEFPVRDSEGDKQGDKQ